MIEGKTRLISIVSKPIKVGVVVVVIAVVVFAKKNWVQKLFDPKAIHVKKSVGPKKNLGQIKVRSQKVLFQIFRLKK